MNETINVKLEHIQELKARIAQIEEDVQKEIEANQTEEWIIAAVGGRSWTPGVKRDHTYFYVREKGVYNNLFQVYGNAKDAARRALMIAQTPQMLELLKEIGKGDSEFAEEANKIIEGTVPTNFELFDPPSKTKGIRQGDRILKRK